eukprot:TRINITY_DN5970_c0_g1_i1.p3 TRINITY_DN5970_c0_g1~~TRINITY_DN5970_c0_g1_i1.p3  ORF type:complete len:289 (+),score=28.26 TRINITY_DN5970_c0_g1_i1:126-992(+)
MLNDRGLKIIGAYPCCPAVLLRHRRFKRVIYQRQIRSEVTDVTQKSPQILIPSNKPLEQEIGKSFSIIEGKGDLQDYANLDLSEIQEKILARKNQIFLLMEDLRRLRIQQRVKGENPQTRLVEQEPYRSTLPFIGKLITEKNLNKYFLLYFIGVVSIILFGGLVAPVLEVRMGIGGATYYEFITSLNLPEQLAEVDPIVAAFCGGAVGVISAVLVVEANNIKSQQRNRCLYCEGEGYLTCGNCSGKRKTSAEDVCQTCYGAGRVMCTACFCTGKQLVTEHDPRFDPFD